MRYARLSFFVFESSIFLFRKVKLWYTKVQKRQKQKKEGYYSNE